MRTTIVFIKLWDTNLHAESKRCVVILLWTQNPTVDIFVWTYDDEFKWNDIKKIHFALHMIHSHTHIPLAVCGQNISPNMRNGFKSVNIKTTQAECLIIKN